MTANGENKLKTSSLRLAGVGLLLVAMGLAYLFLTPKSYQAITRIKVTDWKHSHDAKDPSDLGVVPGECQVLRSNAVVDKVIANLGLKEIWGKRYAQGTTLTTEQAHAMLLSKALIQPDPKSSLIEIRVTSEAPEETARIANEFAHVYLDYRQARGHDLIRDKIGLLKQQWDDANHKLQDALATQAAIYFEITKSRSTNQLQVYDADAYGLLQNKRIEIEGEYTAAQNQLAGLQKMDPDKLKQVLASLDENSLLVPTLNQLNQAKSGLVSARLDHGPESSEVKNAGLVVAEINKRVDQIVAATMSMKETEIAGLKATLDDLDQKIKHGTTNTTHATIADERYTQISEEVKNLQQERDDLQNKMDADASVAETVTPASVTTEIIDTAEIPAKPFTPDRKVAIAIMAAGGGIILVGLLLLALGQKSSPGERKLKTV